MPRIPDEIIDCVFFLYASKEDALAGKNPGGTGFIVQTGKNLWTGGGDYFYGVTNWHVAVKRGFSVVRLNKRWGGTEVIEFGPEQWEFIPCGADVAAVPLALTREFHRTSGISIGRFAPRQDRTGWNSHEDISVGDDVFMLGLFIDHDGYSTNVPSARFGNISLLSTKDAPIRQPTGLLGESYVIDMHSRTGFSGSPVLVYRTFGSDLTTSRHKFDRMIIDDDVRGAEFEYRTLFYFLGIHWGQFPEKWELKNGQTIAENQRPGLITEGAYVEGMSGMTCVIPSWEVAEVLNLSKFQELRAEGGR